MLDDIINRRVQSFGVYFFLNLHMLAYVHEMLLIDILQDDAVDIALDIHHLIQIIGEDLDQLIIGV